MRFLTLTELGSSGNVVSQNMFGANTVFTQTIAGAPDATYAQVAQNLSLQNLRFGGGQGDIDPNTAQSDGRVPVDGSDWISTIKLVDDALRPELVNFLDWCVAKSQATGTPTKATLIIPTKGVNVEAFDASASEIARFAELVMQQYGDVVEAFEIGSEHWEMGEVAYGAKASIAAKALADGMAAAGVAEPQQPKILVQMATAGNKGSLFQATPGVQDFLARNEAANQTIIDQLSSEARAAIDGVVEHYYYNKSHLEFTGGSNEKNYINKDLAVWDAAFDKELDLHITEWNVKTTATSQQGMVAGSTFLEQFEHMISMGADAAHVWAIDLQSRTALTLDTDQGVRLDDAGRVTNSIQGALFDLMADTLVGKELLNAEFTNAAGNIEINSYGDEEETVFYVSSRSFDVQEISLDLSGFVPDGHSVSAIQIVMDPASSNGRQWEKGAPAESVLIDGSPYYYNEHDVDVNLVDLSFTDPGDIDLVLKPFEVVQITVDLDQAPTAPQKSASKKYDGHLHFADHMQSESGGDGLDFLIVDSAAADVRMQVGPDATVFMTPDWMFGDVRLTDVERITFNDGTLAFDADGNAGEAYRLYQACFDRTPDDAGLGFWIDQLDEGGVDLLDMANHFIASAEFQSLYGTPSTLADNDFLTLLYENVLDRTPDKAGFDFWRTQQDDGLSRADMLVYFSESAENVALTSSATDDGIWYI
ncbi:MAG: DUF4214 domain-containing protein [Rhodobacteraceae bacterium]|nr:DUF4214 domain-containing protein [Paracoccaceae bacterium]